MTAREYDEEVTSSQGLFLCPEVFCRLYRRFLCLKLPSGVSFFMKALFDPASPSLSLGIKNDGQMAAEQIYYTKSNSLMSTLFGDTTQKSTLSTTLVR